MTKIIFFNIGWMGHYLGLNNDEITGGGKHIIKNGWGGEVFNYKNNDGYTYGYVQPKINKSSNAFSSTICIERIGASIKDTFIDNITVVFVSTDPVNKGRRIIGWYKNATVFRNSQELDNDTRTLNDLKMPYFTVVKSEDCVLLPKDSRVIKVPKGKGGFGQSNVWFCDKNETFKAKVIDLINGNYKIKATIRGKVSIDIERKQQVERNAIEIVSNYYSDLGYNVMSVEKENCGWDLEVIKDKETLLVEVKGLSKDFISIEFTPNEYSKMYDPKYISKFRIAVVSNAFREKPDFYLFLFSKERNCWQCQFTNKRIEVEQRIGARLRLCDVEV